MRDEREMMSKGEIMECIVKKGKDIRQIATKDIEDSKRKINDRIEQ